MKPSMRAINWTQRQKATCIGRGHGRRRPWFPLAVEAMVGSTPNKGVLPLKLPWLVVLYHTEVDKLKLKIN